MGESIPHAVLDEAFERIEATILPYISMLLASLIDAAAGIGERDPRALAAELRAISAELEGLTRAVERARPPNREPEPIRTAIG